MHMEQNFFVGIIENRCDTVWQDKLNVQILRKKGELAVELLKVNDDQVGIIISFCWWTNVEQVFGDLLPD